MHRSLNNNNLGGAAQTQNGSGSQNVLFASNQFQKRAMIRAYSTTHPALNNVNLEDSPMLLQQQQQLVESSQQDVVSNLDALQKIAQLSQVVAVIKGDLRASAEQIFELKHKIREQEQQDQQRQKTIKQLEEDKEALRRASEYDLQALERKFMHQIRTLREESEQSRANTTQVRAQFQQLNQEHFHTLAEKQRAAEKLKKKMEALKLEASQQREHLSAQFQAKEKQYLDQLLELKKQIREFHIQAGVYEKRLTAMEQLNRTETENLHSFYRVSIENLNNQHNASIQHLSNQIQDINQMFKQTQSEASKKSGDVANLVEEIAVTKKVSRERIEALDAKVFEQSEKIRELESALASSEAQGDKLFRENMRLLDSNQYLEKENVRLDYQYKDVLLENQKKLAVNDEEKQKWFIEASAHWLSERRKVEDRHVIELQQVKEEYLQQFIEQEQSMRFQIRQLEFQVEHLKQEIQKYENINSNNEDQSNQKEAQNSNSESANNSKILQQLQSYFDERVVQLTKLEQEKTEQLQKRIGIRVLQLEEQLQDSKNENNRLQAKLLQAEKQLVTEISFYRSAHADMSERFNQAREEKNNVLTLLENNLLKQLQFVKHSLEEEKKLRQAAQLEIEKLSKNNLDLLQIQAKLQLDIQNQQQALEISKTELENTLKEHKLQTEKAAEKAEQRESKLRDLFEQRLEEDSKIQLEFVEQMKAENDRRVELFDERMKQVVKSYTELQDLIEKRPPRTEDLERIQHLETQVRRQQEEIKNYTIEFALQSRTKANILHNVAMKVSTQRQLRSLSLAAVTPLLVGRSHLNTAQN